MLQYIPRFLSNTAGTCECGWFRRRENFDGNKETMTARRVSRRDPILRARTGGTNARNEQLQVDICQCYFVLPTS